MEFHSKHIFRLYMEFVAIRVKGAKCINNILCVENK